MSSKFFNRPRMFSYVVALMILFIGFKIMGALAGGKKQPEKKELPPQVKLVTTIEVNPSDNPVQVNINGKLESFNKLELFMEVGGRVLNNSKPFKEGIAYRAGEVLISIDSRDAKAALIAQRSSFQTILTQILPDIKLDYSDNFEAWSNYLKNYDAENTTPKLPEVKSEQEKRFLTTKNVYNTYYNIKSQELKLSKYVLTAPFNGVLSSASVQYGSIIRPGQKLGDFIQPGNFELEAPVNVKDVTFLKEGDEVKLTSGDVTGDWKGKIVRIGKNVDARTQSVMVYIKVTDSELKEGMYLSGTIDAQTIPGSVEIPRKLLNNDGSVFTVENRTLKRIYPKVEKIGASTVLLTGIEAGTQILSENFIGAYEGLPVKLPGDAPATKKDVPAKEEATPETSESESKPMKNNMK